jgi:hypothetical protein
MQLERHRVYEIILKWNSEKMGCKYMNLIGYSRRGFASRFCEYGNALQLFKNSSLTLE